MTIEQVRQLGIAYWHRPAWQVSSSASLPLRSFGQIFSGIQIAFTQPIRLDDVVVIEGEWGRIEEIHITYAVVRIWDERRLIVPIDYFLNNPIKLDAKHLAILKQRNALCLIRPADGATAR